MEAKFTQEGLAGGLAKIILPFQGEQANNAYEIGLLRETGEGDEYLGRDKGLWSQKKETLKASFEQTSEGLVFLLDPCYVDALQTGGYLVLLVDQNGQEQAMAEMFIQGVKKRAKTESDYNLAYQDEKKASEQDHKALLEFKNHLASISLNLKTSLEELNKLQARQAKLKANQASLEASSLEQELKNLNDAIKKAKVNEEEQESELNKAKLYLSKLSALVANPKEAQELLDNTYANFLAFKNELGLFATTQKDLTSSLTKALQAKQAETKESASQSQEASASETPTCQNTGASQDTVAFQDTVALQDQVASPKAPKEETKKASKTPLLLGLLLILAVAGGGYYIFDYWQKEQINKAEEAKKAALEAERARQAAEEAERARQAAEEAERARQAAEEAERARQAAEEAERAKAAAEEAERARREAEEKARLDTRKRVAAFFADQNRSPKRALELAQELPANTAAEQDAIYRLYVYAALEDHPKALLLLANCLDPSTPPFGTIKKDAVEAYSYYAKVPEGQEKMAELRRYLEEASQKGDAQASRWLKRLP